MTAAHCSAAKMQPTSPDKQQAPGVVPLQRKLDRACTMSSPDLTEHSNNSDTCELSAAGPVSIIVAGWPDEELPDLWEGLQEFAPSGSMVTFITQCPSSPHATASVSGQAGVGDIGMLGLPETPSSGRCHCTCRTAVNPWAPDALIAAGIHQADALIIGTDTCLTAGEADCSVVSSLLGVQQALKAVAPQHRLHVAAKMQSYGMRRTTQAFLSSMLQRAFSFELLIADEYVSAVLTQVRGRSPLTQTCHAIRVCELDSPAESLPSTANCQTIAPSWL